jgi:hypothetical protein
MSLAFFVQLFVGRHIDHGQRFTGGQLLWRTIAVGILASIGTTVLPLPASVFGGAHPHVTVQGAIFAAELLLITIVAVPVLVGQWRRLRHDKPIAPTYSSPLIIGYSAIYLAVMAFLWITALPAYFNAVNGITAHGDPTGNLWYASACFVIACLCVAAAITTTPRTPDHRDALPPTDQHTTAV